MDDGENIDTNKRFDAKTTAYARKLEFVEGRDPRLRTGHLSLVPANDPAAVVDSCIKGPNGRPDHVSYANIAAAQVMTFEDKVQWFQDTCAQLCSGCNEGHIQIKVRRGNLLFDSMKAVLSLKRKDLRKNWMFQFTDVAGMTDAGPSAREWFQSVTEEIFDPDMGLWMNNATNQMLMEINPASSKCLQQKRENVANLYNFHRPFVFHLTELFAHNRTRLSRAASRGSFALFPLPRPCHGQGFI